MNVPDEIRRIAEETHTELGDLLRGAIGIGGNGGVYQIYLPMKSAFLYGRQAEGAAAITREGLIAFARAVLLDAANAGANNARKQLQAHGIDASHIFEGVSVTTWLPEITEALDAILLIFEKQYNLFRAGLALYRSVDAAVKSFSAGEVARLLSTLALQIYWLAFDRVLEQAQKENEEDGGIVFHSLKRMAIAVLDNRTTQTCRHVHGQVVGLHEPFHLTHEPRFADFMMTPPFHWYCRTSVAIVKA